MIMKIICNYKEINLININKIIHNFNKNIIRANNKLII